MTMPTIEELRARAAEAKRAAKAAELTEDERERAQLAEEEREAKAAEAAAWIARLDTKLAERLSAAKASARGRYLVDGVNLLKLFPLGAAPGPVDKLPGGGVLVLRDPGEAYDAFTREIEAKQRAHSALFTDLLCVCIVDERDEPKDDDVRATQVTLLRAFCERYKGAAVGAGDVAAKLGARGRKPTKEAARKMFERARAHVPTAARCIEAAMDGSATRQERHAVAGLLAHLVDDIRYIRTAYPGK